MSRLLDHFDRVAVISLPGREERRERLWGNLKETGLAREGELTWVEAVDGRLELPPEWWQAGKGAWGCRESHLKVVREAQRDGLESVLILEDDVVFHRESGRFLSTIVSLLPDDWDLFYLGGQHGEKPVPGEDPRLVKGRKITRTHAYAVHERAYEKFLQELGSEKHYRAEPEWHVDHLLGDLQEKGVFEAYAPAWWLAGQEGGRSDISCADDHRRWWQFGSDHWKLPFVNPGPEVEGSVHLYRSEEPVPERRIELAIWLRKAACDAWQRGCLPACSLSSEVISKLWPAGCRSVACEEDLAALVNYPMNGLFIHPFNLTKNQ
ncbi:MAG: glycosyltransferase family 25 protein [Verrucomicrobiaceae bacterium]